MNFICKVKENEGEGGSGEFTTFNRLDPGRNWIGLKKPTTPAGKVMEKANRVITSLEGVNKKLANSVEKINKLKTDFKSLDKQTYNKQALTNLNDEIARTFEHVKTAKTTIEDANSVLNALETLDESNMITSEKEQVTKKIAELSTKIFDTTDQINTVDLMKTEAVSYTANDVELPKKKSWGPFRSSGGSKPKKKSICGSNISRKGWQSFWDRRKSKKNRRSKTMGKQQQRISSRRRTRRTR